MKKSPLTFVCQECGYESSQWLGKCPECQSWNSLKEFKIATLKGKGRTTTLSSLQPQTLDTISPQAQKRLSTGFSEVDGVLGGGIVPGSVTLVAGDPGIGKSTLLLQLCFCIAKTGKKVLYISGEESVEQIKMRAIRLYPKQNHNSLFFISLTSTDDIVSLLEEMKPDLAIIDSVQTMESEVVGGLSGSVGQIRFATSSFIRVAKREGIPLLLVGHVTKEGMVAGPMVLSHMVDTVLFLEGEKTTQVRLLRSLKNRFGAVDEVGVFYMESVGMQEIKNPEQIFLAERKTAVPGSVLTVIMEGTRPFLVEVQALVVPTKLPLPRRVALGIDNRKLEVLLAVLQKHCHLPLGAMDVFINIAGGVKITDPAADLGICLAIYSSVKNKPLDTTVGIGEVGLLGELRKVQSLDKRIKQAKKLGFEHILTSQTTSLLSDILQKAV